MSHPRTRPLTQSECELAFEVFGHDLRLDTIRFWAAPWPINRAFVPGNWFGRDWIVWPTSRWITDMTCEPLGQQAVFIHELVHVWQAQQGLNLLFGKLKAGDSMQSYTYPVSDGCEWSSLNIEQQAMIVEHRFRLSRGGHVPADQAFYDRVCPLAQSVEI